MPKKTKREKLLAQKHRAQDFVSFTPSVLPPTPEPDQKFHLTISPSAAPKIQPLATTQEFTAIKHDLQKTIIITVGIIVAELLLSHYLPH